jgi:hypothetical protein
MVGSTLDESIEFDPITGKGASSSKTGKGSDEITPAVALAMGLGDRQFINIADKTSDALNINVVSLPLLDDSHKALANATLS